MEWLDKAISPMRRVWNGVATRLGIRKSGLLMLRHDVRTSEYKDVHIMWEILNRNEMEHARFPASARSNKRPFYSFFQWASCSPCLCRSL